MAYNQGGPTTSLSAGGFQDVLNSWISTLTRPSVPVLAAEIPRASQNRIIMSVGVATVVAAILGALGQMGSGHALGGFIYSLIATPIGFGLNVLILNFAARMMRGTGNLQEQAWVQSTYWAPILILGAIPFVGGILSLIGWLYSIYLTYLTVQAVHRLDGTNAIVAMIISAVLTLIAGVLLGIVLAAIFIPLGLLAGAASGS